MGWLARRLGLACDNLASFEVVTAEGTALWATETEHPDLWWGLQGAGGMIGAGPKELGPLRFQTPSSYRG
jgi:FAD/FMN-containing dehydrogenase